jgi:hypothetical protein
MKGVNGASSCDSVTRMCLSVSNAARSPSQKRRRESRTYQLERSTSMNAAIPRPAFVASNASRPSVTSVTSALRRERIQRSSSVGSPSRSGV